MKNTMTVEAQTINAADTTSIDFDIEVLLPKATDVALAAFKGIGSDSLRNYVKGYPDEFKEIKGGFDGYCNDFINKESDLLNLPEDMKLRVSRIALIVLKALCFPVGEVIVELAEKYRKEAMEEIMGKYEYEDEDIAWDRHFEAEQY